MSVEIVFIVDRSGSMQGSESDTIGGYNAFLHKQKAQEGEARVTTVLFDNQYELLHDAVELPMVTDITEHNYFVRGTTALYDALGQTIERVKARTSRAIFVIITDGLENASVKYTADHVKELIGERQAAGWEFFYLGADLENFADADRIGIRPDRRTSFAKDITVKSYQGLSKVVYDYREGKEQDKDWDEKVKGKSEDDDVPY